jgi:hypothetical protein
MCRSAAVVATRWDGYGLGPAVVARRRLRSRLLLCCPTRDHPRRGGCAVALNDVRLHRLAAGRRCIGDGRCNHRKVGSSGATLLSGCSGVRTTAGIEEASTAVRQDSHGDGADRRIVGSAVSIIVSLLVSGNDDGGLIVIGAVAGFVGIFALRFRLQRRAWGDERQSAAQVARSSLLKILFRRHLLRF